MVGPFMQGMFLMGIIYWYSKGMLALINDYYRNEFQRNLQTNDDKSEKAKPYNAEDIERLLQVDDELGLLINDKSAVKIDLPLHVCFRVKSIQIFEELLQTVSSKQRQICSYNQKV